MIDRSQFIAEMVDKKVEDSAYVDGMLIGLDALPDQKSLGIRARLTPSEDSALHALDGAWRKWSSHWGERKNLAGHTGPVTDVAFSPDGTRISPAPMTKRQSCGTRRRGPRSRRLQDTQNG
jgi:WD40 repeat protein